MIKIFLFTFGLLHLVLAKDVVLYREGSKSPVSNYLKRLGGVEANDFLVFGSGKKVQVGKELGRGKTTVIFELAHDQDKVIRVPIRGGDRFYIENYAEASDELVSAGFPAPKVLAHHSFGQYLIVDRVEFDFTLHDLLSWQAKISPVERLRLLSKLDELDDLVKKASMQTHVYDLHSENIVYSRKSQKWILLDFTASDLPADKRFGYYREHRVISMCHIFKGLQPKLPRHRKIVLWSATGGLLMLGGVALEELTLGMIMNHKEEIYRHFKELAEKIEQKKGSPKTP